MTTAAIEVILLAIKLSTAVIEQVELAEHETLPMEVRAALLQERVRLNAALNRLDKMS